MDADRRGPRAAVPEAQSAVLLYTSRRGLATAVLTPLLVLGFAVAAWSQAGGAHPVALTLAVVASGLGIGVALDYPRYTRFDACGITRVCVMREHLLPWPAVVAIEPARTAVARRGRVATDRPSTRRGGLVARTHGRRRYLLIDRAEGAIEHDRLARLLQELRVGTALLASRPPDTTPPTDLRRSSRQTR